MARPIRRRVTVDFEPDSSLTEQEHKDSCDINLMIKNILAGRMVRGGTNGIYGYDDVNMTGLQHRINKQNINEAIEDLVNNREVTEEQLLEFQKINPKLAKRLKVRKKEANVNDDKTTNANAPNSAPITPPSSTPDPGQKPS